MDYTTVYHKMNFMIEYLCNILKFIVSFFIFQILDTIWNYNVVSEAWSGGRKMNTKKFDHACFVDEATSSVDVLGGYNDQWNSISSTEK